ncbi:HalOD1 output domain-containing protein [Haloferax sp. DFSO60]|uniref:HalOD1 output domain-containing protein n=1 Tax=Haloferax sp. DFSO60 TaxID=3388652 RepID=UPI0039799A48
MTPPVKNRPSHTTRASRISEAVVEALAAKRDADPLSVTPLYNAIDPEALDMLFAPTLDSSVRPGGTVRFQLTDCEVKVTVEDGDAHVEITHCTEQT